MKTKKVLIRIRAYYERSVQKVFLSGQALIPPLLAAGPLKKILFLQLPQIEEDNQTFRQTYRQKDGQTLK